MSYLKWTFSGTGEMVQQLGAHAALVKDCDSFPSTHMAVQQPYVTPALGDLKPFPYSCGDQVYMWYTYVHSGKTLRYLKIFKYILTF